VFKGYQMGGVDYIYKPINPELLRAKVAVFAELFRKNNELRIQEQKLAAANRLLEKEIQDRILSEAKVNQLNTQLLENVTELKSTNEELERFAYVASHDLQEPLRKIMLFCGQLVSKHRSNLNDDGVLCLDKIIKASERMQMLIKNILSISRLSANSGDFEFTDLGVLVAGVLSDLDVSVQQKNATIIIEPLPSASVIPEQFRQLFQNLIVNALKFSKENDTPNIRIYCEKVIGKDVPGIKDDWSDEAFFRIHVKDNGIGFEQKYADGIFTLFKRLNGLDKYEGTGIGLSICKKIMEQHHGTIYATSVPDEGSIFTLAVPVTDLSSRNGRANGLPDEKAGLPDSRSQQPSSLH